MKAGKTTHWDIFCHVIDNYGDIGVCWRLARQLAMEFGFAVRLIVDDPGSMQRICPEIDPDLAIQYAREVEILRWVEPFPDLVPADVVIEAFGCELPICYVVAMAARKTSPLWINLEYLSAERWVEGCHGLASPHPNLPLIRYFFFPGFTAATGGLIRETGLFAQRDLSQTDLAKLWQELDIPSCPIPKEIIVSLFCYHSAPVDDLLDAWVNSTSPVRCLLPEDVASQPIASWAGKLHLAAGECIQHGNLTLQIIPFMSQENYDRLLWACDCNFVRGEDSFVRAQWAARPFIWQIYPQQENIHLAKLNAFLDLYCQNLDKDAADALRAFHQGWNNNGKLNWDALREYQEILQSHATDWANQLGKMPDLAFDLVNFCRNQQ